MNKKISKALKKSVGVVALSLCLITGLGTYASAASYSAYALKLNKTNNFTSVHDKVTADNYITNEVTAITNTSYANFWAINSGKSKISNKYKQGVGTGSVKILFTSSGYDGIGKQVGMGMENYVSQLSNAFVSGNVNFR